MILLVNFQSQTNMNKKELHGYSAEGHVSHIYSDRMSSRPMGWSRENINNMSRLRTTKEDNVSIEEILRIGTTEEKILFKNLLEYKAV